MPVSCAALPLSDVKQGNRLNNKENQANENAQQIAPADAVKPAPLTSGVRQTNIYKNDKIEERGG
jgi:hypothetical protein